MMKRLSLFALCLLLGFSTQLLAESKYVTPGSKAEGLENCVEETTFMRTMHMKLVNHLRDETVHEGIRGHKHSLAGCVDCHVSVGADKKAIPINAEDQFCETCHAKAAVSMDCFQCHATVPRDRPGAMPASHK